MVRIHEELKYLFHLFETFLLESKNHKVIQQSVQGFKFLHARLFGSTQMFKINGMYKIVKILSLFRGVIHIIMVVTVHTINNAVYIEETQVEPSLVNVHTNIRSLNSRKMVSLQAFTSLVYKRAVVSSVGNTL